MRRLPFPYALSLGTDITSLSRINSIIARGKTARFVRRILQPQEIDDLTLRIPNWRHIHDYTGKPGPDAGRLLTFLAGRWAAKEATRKAVGARLLGQKDVRVEVTESGTIEVAYSTGRSESGDGGEGGVVEERVGLCSISHDTEYAVASVLAVPIESSGSKGNSGR